MFASRSKCVVFACSCRSLHAHIMLWLDNDSHECVKSEITAGIPGVPIRKSVHLPVNNPARYEDPECPAERALLSYVLREHLPTCSPLGQGCRKHNHCALGFPYAVHSSRTAQPCRSLLKWSYHRPTEDCRNVVPHHPTIFLLWKGVHAFMSLLLPQKQPLPFASKLSIQFLQLHSLG